MRTQMSCCEARMTALISTQLQPGVVGSGRGETVSTVSRMKGRLTSGADASGIARGSSPSPRPSPSGRGSDALRSLPTGTAQQFEGWLTFSLSQRERAGVRENASLARFMCRVSESRPAAWSADAHVRSRAIRPWASGLPSPTDGDCKSPARVRTRATGTLIPSLSFHTHQPPTHRRTP